MRWKDNSIGPADRNRSPAAGCWRADRIYLYLQAIRTRSGGCPGI